MKKRNPPKKMDSELPLKILDSLLNDPGQKKINEKKQNNIDTNYCLGLFSLLSVDFYLHTLVFYSSLSPIQQLYLFHRCLRRICQKRK